MEKLEKINEDIKTKYRRMANFIHPDKDGDTNKMKEVTAAYDKALAGDTADLDNIYNQLLENMAEENEVVDYKKKTRKKRKKFITHNENKKIDINV